MSILSGATRTAYFDWPEYEVYVCNECRHVWPTDDGDSNECAHCGGIGDVEARQEDGDIVVDFEFRGMLMEMFPSLRPCDRWEHNEDHIILESSLVEVGYAEYCGMTSLSFRPHKDLPEHRYGLAERWINSAWPKVDKAYGQYYREGAMSNGEQVYTTCK